MTHHTWNRVLLGACGAAALLLGATAATAVATATTRLATAAPSVGSLLVQAQAKTCRREPIWGFRISAFCKPTGICPDRVIKGYRTVCS